MMRATGKMLMGVFLRAWHGGKVTLLTMMVALTLATVTPAFGANGGAFILGSLNNTATAITRLVGNVNGPALYLVNPNTGASATGALFQVASGHPPFRVTSATKVANLNADLVDGKDSTALGITTKTKGNDDTYTCTSPGVWSECSPVTVTVPPGKQYNVTVLSAFTAIGASNTWTYYCPGIRGGSIAPSASCIDTGSTPNGFRDYLSLASGYSESGASSGEIGPLPAGTYTFSTIIRPQAALSSGGQAHTTVLVSDVSAPGPPIG